VTPAVVAAAALPPPVDATAPAAQGASPPATPVAAEPATLAEVIAEVDAAENVAVSVE